MCASSCISYRHFGDTCNGCARLNCSICVKQPTMAMVRVFAETDIACDEERREYFAQFLDGENDRTVWIVCWSASKILYALY